MDVLKRDSLLSVVSRGMVLIMELLLHLSTDLIISDYYYL